MQITSTNNYRYDDEGLKSLRVYYQERYDEDELRETLNGSVIIAGDKYEGKTQEEILTAINAKREELKGDGTFRIAQTDNYKYDDDGLVSLRVRYQEQYEIDELRETLTGGVVLGADQYEVKTQEEVLQAVQDKRDEIKGAE